MQKILTHILWSEILNCHAFLRQKTTKTFQPGSRPLKVHLDSWGVYVQVSLSVGEFGDGKVSSKAFFSHPRL